MKRGRGILFLALAVVVFSTLFVSATTTIVRPVASGNYSATMIVNVTTDLANAMNVTIYYNASGGAVGTSNVLVVILNDSASDTQFYNASVSIAGLTDGTYNFTAMTTNLTGSTQTSTGVASVKVDNTAPVAMLSSFVSLVNYGNYSDASTGLILINVTVSDAISNISSVYFNLTDSSGIEQAKYNSTLITIGYTDYWNASVNVSSLTDGTYNMTLWVTDYAGNINNSASFTLRVDNDAPTVSLALDDSETSSTKIVFVATISGAESGVTSSCNVSGSGVILTSVTGSGTASQTITQDEVGCLSSFNYTVTCTTYTGLTGSESGVFSSLRCSSGSTSGPSSTSTWSNSYVINEGQLTEGYSNNLKAKERFKFKVNSVDHSVGVKSISGNSVTLEIASTPTEISLAAGEEAKLDLNEDGYYDTYVKVESIESNQAKVMIKSVYEKVPEGADSISVTDVEGNERPIAGDNNTINDEGGMSSGYWIGGIVLIIVIIAAVIAMKRR